MPLPVLNASAIERTIITGQPPQLHHPRGREVGPEELLLPRHAEELPDLAISICLSVLVAGFHSTNWPIRKTTRKTIVNPGKTVELTRIHLEEDVAKSTAPFHLHDDRFQTARELLSWKSSPSRISTPPKKLSPTLNSLRQILVYSGVSDADMEKGQMRCDVNISVRPESTDELGTKIELKNLNSPTSSVRRSIHYEVDRQIAELEAREHAHAGQLGAGTTRIGQTEIMRTKEDAHDYRYFPDPDLLPVKTGEILARVQQDLPELPLTKKWSALRRITRSLTTTLPSLTSEQVLAGYYETAAKGAKSPKKGRQLGHQQSPRRTERAFSHHRGMRSVRRKKSEPSSISSKQDRFPTIRPKRSSPISSPHPIANQLTFAIRRKGFEPADSGEVEGFINQAIADNPGPAGEVAEGNDKATNFLTGQVMRLSRGKSKSEAGYGDDFWRSCGG